MHALMQQLVIELVQELVQGNKFSEVRGNKSSRSGVINLSTLAAQGQLPQGPWAAAFPITFRAPAPVR